jgi:hypothetical protein
MHGLRAMASRSQMAIQCVAQNSGRWFAQIVKNDVSPNRYPPMAKNSVRSLPTRVGTPLTARTVRYAKIDREPRARPE